MRSGEVFSVQQGHILLINRLEPFLSYGAHFHFPGAVELPFYFSRL